MTPYFSGTTTMKKHASFIIGILFTGIVCLMADFQVSTALAENLVFDITSELPDLRNDTILQTPTLYASPTVSADCKNTLALLLAETPPTLLPNDLAIELRNAPLTEFHGLSAAHAIKLNCGLPEKRFREVFYHELGHIVYNGFLPEQKKVFEKREEMYAVNGAPNYITQYALTNADEDFADSFMIYMTRKEVFLEKAEKSAVLHKKYESIDSYPKLLYNSFD